VGLKQKDTPGAMVVEKIEQYISKRSEGTDWKEFKAGMCPESA
jgi:hypothetical protein